MELFSCENISQVASKTCATQRFFSDHLNDKTEKRTNCRTPSTNPCQLGHTC